MHPLKRNLKSSSNESLSGVGKTYVWRVQFGYSAERRAGCSGGSLIVLRVCIVFAAAEVIKFLFTVMLQ